MMLFCSVLVLLLVLVLIGVKRNREVEPQIVSVLLRYGEMHGLQIGEAIEQDFGKKPGWGILYPGLRRLERQGFVSARWGDERSEARGGARRRYYQRTGRRIELKDCKAADLKLTFSQPLNINLSLCVLSLGVTKELDYAHYGHYYSQTSPGILPARKLLFQGSRP